MENPSAFVQDEVEEEVVLDENGNPMDKLEVYKLGDEWKETRAEIVKIQPIRVSLQKRYWDKFKYNKDRRDHMIELFDDADDQVAFYLGDDYVDWRDSIAGARQLIDEMTKKKIE